MHCAGYQRCAQHAGQYDVEVAGGRVPTSDWMLNLHILTSGGLRYADDPLHHVMRWNVGFSSTPSTFLTVRGLIEAYSPHNQRQGARSGRGGGA